MANNEPISIFLDETLVDELWTLASGDPLAVEKGKEVSAKVAAKGTFGLGKVWKWIAGDINAELSAEGSNKYSTKLQLTSVYRAMLSPDMIGDVPSFGPVIDVDDHLNLQGFIKLEVSTLELFPLPSYADFVRYMAIAQMEDTSIKSKDVDDYERTLSLTEKLVSAKRAMTFCHRILGGDESSFSSEENLLLRLFGGDSSEAKEAVINELCMSNDDHVLALSTLSIYAKSEPSVSDQPFESNSANDDYGSFLQSLISGHSSQPSREPKEKVPEPCIVFLVLPERYLKRHLSAFATNRPVEIFGKVAYSKGSLLGIEAISISLS